MLFHVSLSRMSSKPAASINNGMTKLTSLHHACRTESAAVHFSLSTVLSTSEHRSKKRPKLTTGGSQKRQLSTEDRDLPAKSQSTHQTATMAVRMNRPKLRKLAQITLCFASSARSAAQRNQRVAAMGKSRTAPETVDRFAKLAKMGILLSMRVRKEVYLNGDRWSSLRGSEFRMG